MKKSFKRLLAALLMAIMLLSVLSACGGGNNENMPTTELTKEDFTDGVIDIITIMVKGGQATTRSDARRNLEQGGVAVNGEKVTDIKTTYDADAFDNEFIVKKGKKSFMKYVLK